MPAAHDTISLSLVSHTNVGKTTLTRTLLRRDVGEVRDEAHTTDTADAFELIGAGSARLLLYDTPGLGDTVRLLRRLRAQANPVGWLLAQVWDRFADRPFWCSQQAIRATREDGDLVLYLVNATEAPDDAGYVRHEFDLLAWVDRPVLILLNQTGPARPAGLETEGALTLEARWRAYASAWPIVRDVLPLDAFSRCWVHEGVLFERILPHLPEAKRPAMRACVAAWHARNQAVFRTCLAKMADYLARAAADREPLTARVEGAGGLAESLGFDLRSRSRAMQAIRTRLELGTRALVDALILEHGLEGHSTVELRQRLQDFSITGASWLTPARGAAVGGVVSGALGGLVADLLVGGLSFGSGLVAGALLGALGGAGLGHGYQLAAGTRAPTLTWAPDFLRDLARQTVLRYLAVAHFGRGRGGYEDVELPAAWREVVDRALLPVDAELTAAWQAAGRDPAPDDAARILERLLMVGTRGALVASYPEAARFLEPAPTP